MNKTKNIHNHNKNKLFVASIAIIVVVLTLFVGPMLNVDDALATHTTRKIMQNSP